MATQEEVVDSPTDWVNAHIQEYVKTDGESGHKWKGADTLLITTRGRKSGKARRTALIYGVDDGSYVVVASQGGAPQHPAWYFNLSEHPEVELQVGADKMTAEARDATDQERERLWPLMTSIWPAYDSYQAKTDRQIPVVILTPR